MPVRPGPGRTRHRILEDIVWKWVIYVLLLALVIWIFEQLIRWIRKREKQD